MLKNKGITLIALIITIIVLLILAGISIATLTGENGILAKASKAKEKTKQENGAEVIKLAVNEMLIEKKSELEDLTIDYIGDHIHEKLKIEKEDVTKNGNPVESVDVVYEDYVYRIDDNFQVKVICTTETRITIEGRYELQGNKAIIYITAKTKDEQGIKKIILPNDEEREGLNQKEMTIEYEVTNNEEYKFLAIGNNESTRSIRINVEGIDLNPPNEAQITLNKTSEWVGGSLTGTITATVKVSDNNSGIDNEKCKYIINEEANKIGVDSSKWSTAEILQSENTKINISSNTASNKFIHVLSVNKSGNKIETVSKQASFVVDKTPPNEAVIIPNQFVQNVPYVIGFKITISDNQSGIDLKRCRYVFLPTKDKIGSTSNAWAEGHPCEGAITSSVEEKGKGKYYIHVLTYDKVGNYTETVLAEPVEWIAKTRILDYTETYTTPTGWAITAGSYTYRGLQNGTFKTKSLINLSNYSSINFSIVTQSDGYVTHGAYIDFIDTSGTKVKTLEQVWSHGSTCVNPYTYTGTMNLSEIPKGSYYIQVTSRNIGGIYNGFISTGTYIDIIP